jgi:hypothetical protein
MILIYNRWPLATIEFGLREDLLLRDGFKIPF